MADRPTFIDLSLRQYGAATPPRLGFPSPRIQHQDGDIPPSLSPLDAFAAQSRLMAKELDAKKRRDRRMSRLPPAAVTKSLSQHRMDRPEVFRSLSAEPDDESVKREDSGSGSIPGFAHPKIRPLSQHLQIAGAPGLDEVDRYDEHVTPMDHCRSVPLHYQCSTSNDYFGTPRTQSPENASVKSPYFGVRKNKNHIQRKPVARGEVRQERTPTTESSNSQPDLAFTLLPPNAAFARSPNHARAHHESSDDDYTSSNAGSTFSQPRKLSSSSGTSTPHSPLSSFIPVGRRSPSMNSETSMTGCHRSKSFLNFSRPMSSADTNHPSLESPSRQQSANGHTSQPSLSSIEAPQRSLTDDSSLETQEGFISGTGSAYTYAKWSLPRGRLVSRDSSIFQSLSTPHFEWKEPLFESTHPIADTPRSSLEPTSPSRRTLDPKAETKSNEGSRFSFEFDRPKTPEQPLKKAASSSPTDSLKTAISSPGSSVVERGDLRTMRAPPIPTAESEDARSTSSKSNSTVRPYSVKTTTSNYQCMSPDDHVTKGIQCHEQGSLKESTYHLRVAAMQNHPTAMLLYALACRHGWGMRPNQREGVQWLRKAVDSAMMEIADDEDPSSGNAAKDLGEKKTRRAQFALSIYELGVSHLNGWGIEQDKALALRCFEIAGNWGDSDALSEAGFCYAEGIGCKKDLKKAAKLYRLAESRGVSMIGNSWIYKDKYNDVEPTPQSSPTQLRSTTPESKQRNKGRTRSIFGRKKSVRSP